MCGFVGMIGQPQASTALGIALQALQHRGQDATGIATFDAGRIHIHKDLGMVSAVFTPDALQRLRGSSGIGHVRYPTVGGGLREDSQPFWTRRPGVVMAHNGNVTNLPSIAAWLRKRSVHLQSSCDVEPILMVFAEALVEQRNYKDGDKNSPGGDYSPADVVAAVTEVFRQVRGAYTCVALMELEGRETLVAFRDPDGIRPGAFARGPGGAWMAASETVAFDALGFTREADLPPGRVVLLRAGEEPVILPASPVPDRPSRNCIFERIYFARPDSQMEDGFIYDIRWRMGQQLGEEWRRRGLSADVVIPVPDTSRPAAQAMAETLGLPFREGFIKNRYSGRTFIMPDAPTRDAALRVKLNVLPQFFEGKRVILVDDSVVRGTTVRRMTDLIRQVRPAEVHLAIFSPPVRNPCFYGIDMPSRDDLVAARLPEEAWAAAFGVDTVTFLSLDGLRSIAGRPICMACFDGDYPVPVSQEEESLIVADRRG